MKSKNVVKIISLCRIFCIMINFYTFSKWLPIFVIYLLFLFSSVLQFRNISIASLNLDNYLANSNIQWQIQITTCSKKIHCIARERSERKDSIIIFMKKAGRDNEIVYFELEPYFLKLITWYLMHKSILEELRDFKISAQWNDCNVSLIIRTEVTGISDLNVV